MILVLDNHDSYTYNLVQALREHSTRTVHVCSASDHDEAVALVRSGIVDALVVSPGPGHPARADDFAGADAVLEAAMSRRDMPILGVCLGHQGLARRLGFEVRAAPRPRHGWRSPIRHTADGVFEGLPQGTLATRYHSLAVRMPDVTDPAPGDLVGAIRVTAVSEDDVVQGFDVPGHPWFGVQFHPESIASAHGPLLLQNFLRIVDGIVGDAGGTASVSPSADPASSTAPASSTGSPSGGTGRRGRTVGARARAWSTDPELAISTIESRVLRRGAGSFRLDVPAADGRTPRWIVLGDAVDLLGHGTAHVLRYRPGTVAIDTYDCGDDPTDQRHDRTDRPEPRRRHESCEAPIADLERRLAHLVGSGAWGDAERAGRDGTGTLPGGSHPARGDRGPDLPFDPMDPLGEAAGPPLRDGYIGVLGYEAGVRALGLEPAPSAGPEAVFVRPMRYFVVEPAARRVSVIVLDDDAELAEATCREQERQLAEMLARPASASEHTSAEDVAAVPPTLPSGSTGRAAPVGGRWRHDRADYLTRIAACQRALEAGDSYELCLTNRFEVDAAVDPDPLDLFRELRRTQAAPFAALLEVDDDGDPIAIVSASPERFIRMVDGEIETKPIKGTAARDADPAEDARAAAHLASDPKTFAENLMIVDLLRNDLGRVCVPGSVTVPSLMRVETYPSVHQLVSTVRGRLAPGLTSCDVLRALHPGGSMTGAPKERTIRILGTLEGEARGFYSGSLGIVGADGRLEQSIVIRTAVRAGGRWSIGAGGAVVLDSDPDAEFDEVELKADAIRRAFTAVVHGGRRAART